MVKLSGYRIEPGDIEAVLCACPGVLAARVIVQGEHLRAFIAAKQVSEDELENWLRRRLPVYMIPHTIKILDALPVDERTGKVKLPALHAL
jgi:acyl-coenzyme A synthetase/AMP-(fatty) acid ligase